MVSSKIAKNVVFRARFEQKEWNKAMVFTWKPYGLPMQYLKIMTFCVIIKFYRSFCVSMCLSVYSSKMSLVYDMLCTVCYMLLCMDIHTFYAIKYQTSSGKLIPRVWFNWLNLNCMGKKFYESINHNNVCNKMNGHTQRQCQSFSYA